MKRNTAIWVLTAFLAIAFFAAGGSKVLGITPHPANFARWGFPDWFTYAVGIGEVLGALALLVPRLSAWGGAWLCAIMIGAVLTRVHSGELREVLPPLVLLSLLSFVTYARREPAVALLRGLHTEGA